MGSSIEKIRLLEKENAELKMQLIQNNLTHVKDEKWAQNIIDCLPNPLFIKDEHHRFFSLNKAFVQLINIKKEELIGKTDLDFFSEEQARIFMNVDKEVLANGRINWNEEQLTVDGITHALLTSKVRIEDGNNKKYILGLITDITDNKNQQVLLMKKKDEVEKQKERIQILLKEIHHRVKNNLQIVSSLLNIQMSQFDEHKVQDAFSNCKNRILAMASVHEILYQTDNFKDINFEEYLLSLVKNIKKSLRLTNDIKFNIDTITAFFNIEFTIPLGLIINEIITNSVKHGSIDESELEIYISMQSDKTAYSLEIGDNGLGIENYNEVKSSMGRELIDVFSQQLDAALTEVEKEKGLHYRIHFNYDQ